MAVAFQFRDNLRLQVKIGCDNSKSVLRYDVPQGQVCCLGAFKDLRALENRIEKRSSEVSIANTVIR